MNKYEFTVVYIADETKKQEAIKAVEALLQSKNISVLNRKEWGLKTLAYEIKKQDRGFYIFYELEMDGKEITDIERELSLNPSILRHLFVREVYRKVKRRPFKTTEKEKDEQPIIDKDAEAEKMEIAESQES